MTENSRRSRRKGTLAIVGSLLLLSAILRLATGTGQVIANEAIEKLAQPDLASPENLDLARPERMLEALAAMNAREAKIDAREEEVALREKNVEIAEEAIEKELSRLEEAEQRLRATINIASDASENDIAQLTDVYANMKPKQAAALFEQMDARFAAGFLARMPPDTAAKIMTGMSPETAYHVSVELAGRNAEIPLE